MAIGLRLGQAHCRVTKGQFNLSQRGDSRDPPQSDHAGQSHSFSGSPQAVILSISTVLSLTRIFLSMAASFDELRMLELAAHAVQSTIT